MNKLTVKIDNIMLDEDFNNYLLNLNGVNNIMKDDNDDQIITLEYGEDITLYMLIQEMLLYLDVVNIPSISYFNKYLTNSLEVCTIEINDLCCGYCFNMMIEELLYMDGISRVYSDFDGINKDNVLIYICYDKGKIKEIDLKEKFK